MKYKTANYFKQLLIENYIPNNIIIDAVNEEHDGKICLLVTYEIDDEDIGKLRALLNKELPIPNNEEFIRAKKRRHEKIGEYFDALKNRGV